MLLAFKERMCALNFLCAVYWYEIVTLITPFKEEDCSMVRQGTSTRIPGKLVSVSAMLLAAVMFALTAVLPTCAWAQNAKSIYGEKCEACHGATGKGDGPAGKSLTPPPGDFAVTLKGKSDAWITKAIKEGGAAVGKAATMPAYSDMTDKQLKELVGYIKKL